VIAALTGAGRFDLSARLGEIRAPALVVDSTRDRVAPTRAAKTLANIPGVRVVTIDGASHLPYLQEPERVVAVLSEFLAEVDAKERA
jgi:pimeloyl-ACP methyl ester carboxylesterase